MPTVSFWSISVSSSLITRSGGTRTSRQPGHFQVTKVVRLVIGCKRQCHCNKGARFFRGQKILTGCTFFLNVDELFVVVALQTQTAVKIKQMNRSDIVTFRQQGEARAVDLPAGSFDVARPGVAPPLISRHIVKRSMFSYVRLSCRPVA